MIHLSISVTLLSIVAAMYLLHKTQKENLGGLFKWVSYIVLAVAVATLLCQLTCGIMMMRCHGQEGSCRPRGMGQHHMMMRGHCGPGEDCGKDEDCHGKGSCSGNKSECNGECEDECGAKEGEACEDKCEGEHQADSTAH